MGDLSKAIQDFKTALTLPVEQLDNGTRCLLIEKLLDIENFNEAIPGTTILIVTNIAMRTNQPSSLKLKPHLVIAYHFVHIEMKLLDSKELIKLAEQYHYRGKLKQAVSLYSEAIVSHFFFFWYLRYCGGMAGQNLTSLRRKHWNSEYVTMCKLFFQSSQIFLRDIFVQRGVQWKNKIRLDNLQTNYVACDKMIINYPSAPESITIIFYTGHPMS